jgi:hypothetical protein
MSLAAFVPWASLFFDGLLSLSRFDSCFPHDYTNTNWRFVDLQNRMGTDATHIEVVLRGL